MFIALRCQHLPLVSIGFCWWLLLRMDLLLHTKRLCHKALIHSPIFNTPSDCHLLCFSRAAKPDPNSVSMWFFGPFRAGMALLQEESWVSSGPFCSVCSPFPVLNSHCPVAFYTYFVQWQFINITANRKEVSTSGKQQHRERVLVRL